MSDLTDKSSVYAARTGRYVIGGTTEVSSWAIEMWDPKTLPLDPSDLLYVVEKRYENKPRKLGLLFYGDENLWWVICQYNLVINPTVELKAGTLLRIPIKERIMSALQQGAQIGGIPSTRTKSSA